MSTPNAPFGFPDWEKWFKSPWWGPHAGQAMGQDPGAAFTNMASMWFGGHPAFPMPADSMSALMKDAGTAWADLMKKAALHQGILMEGWKGAFSEFGRDLSVWMPTIPEAAEADTIDSLDALVTRWSATAEPVLQQHAKSEGFIKSQAALISAAIKWQKAKTAVGEAISKQAGIPTRSDVDEAYRMIHELRRAIRRDQNKDRAAPTPAPSRRKPRASARVSKGAR